MIEYICHLKSLGGNTDSAIHIPHLGPARRSSRGQSGWAAISVLHSLPSHRLMFVEIQLINSSLP